LGNGLLPNGIVDVVSLQRAKTITRAQELGAICPVGALKVKSGRGFLEMADDGRKGRGEFKRGKMGCGGSRRGKGKLPMQVGVLSPATRKAKGGTILLCPK
jgi:hypothetical protein